MEASSLYKVIIVDDEQMIKKSLATMLSWDEENFQLVGEAENGVDALQLIEHVSPDLVITDINMPEMDGLELVELARSHGYSNDFVIVTGYSEFEYAQKALRYQVSDYLLKPIKPDVFMDYLETFKIKHNTLAQEELNRNRLLQSNMINAQEIAEEVWQLNESGIRSRVQQLEKDKVSDFRDLYYMVIGCLNELSSNVSELEWPEAKLEQLSLMQLETILLEAIASIRMKRNWGNHRSIQAAVEYINAHYQDNQLSLQDAANVVNMSASFFSRSFKEAMGINFIQYITKLRMEKAKQLLIEQEDLRTYEIAYEIGYVDYPHFTKAFKKYSGLSPSEYRRNMGEIYTSKLDK